MAAVPGLARIDAGRLAMVPAASALLLIDVITLVHLAHGGAAGVTGVLRWLGTGLVCSFYLLVIWCYLRRGPARATSRSVTAHGAAVIATLAAFAFPLLHGGPAGASRQAVSDTLLVAGTAWAVWSLRFLGRNLSVIAQARDVVDRGPYRFVRHPLYTGEIVSSLGLVVASGTVAAVGVWLALCALQVYRALREEQVLVAALPGYRDYRGRTAALLPGIF